MRSKHVPSGWIATASLLTMWAVPIFAQQVARPADEPAAGNRVQVERGGLRTAQGKRPWGPEQATGEPDTPQAGDTPTAWASANPDGGMEWLKVGFDRAVRIAQVRIRESYNPGAVSKVAAITADGKEQVVWEGRDSTKDAPSDLVVPVQQDVTAGTVKIYLDSNRVPGWNEIDAVELVGADGSRQWASSAAASSTYADRTSGLEPMPQRPVAGPFAPLQGKQIVVHLEGDKLVTGTLTQASGGFLTIEGSEGLTTFVVNVQKIVYVEAGQ